MNSEIRIGRVSSVNYETGMARVTYRDKDESVTSEFPIVTNNDEYRMPATEQDVIVAHLSNGSSRGVIIGTIWNQKYTPFETGETLYRKDLSREKDAAYIRYSDETGEYLVKAANIHINGVHKSVFDGPEVEVAANISLLLQGEILNVDTMELNMTGGESENVNANIKAEINISQEEHGLQATIMKAIIEVLEYLDIKTGTGMELKAGENVQLSAGGQLVLEDGKYNTTLTEIMERLEALEARGG